MFNFTTNLADKKAELLTVE